MSFFFSLHNIMLTDKKSLKLLEWVMIEYIHKNNDHIFLDDTNSKIYVLD